MKSIYIALAATTLAAFTGCADTSRPLFSSPAPYYAPGYNAAQNITAYGVVTAVRAVDMPVGVTSGGGALLGGLAGGVLGHQVGRGSGNTAATIGGAAIGALVGNEIERGQGVSSRRVYEVDVRLDDGTYQTVTQNDSTFRVGERVLLQNGTLMHR